MITLLAVVGYVMLRVYNTPKAAKPVSAESISVVLDDNYPPYVFRDAKGKLQGILVDQWMLWSKTTGINVDLNAMDWADALNEMRAGKYDVIDTVFENEERDTWLDFSKPYVTIDVPIFHSKDIGGITDVKSITQFSVAVKAGDACIPILQDAGVQRIEQFP